MPFKGYSYYSVAKMVMKDDFSIMRYSISSNESNRENTSIDLIKFHRKNKHEKIVMHLRSLKSISNIRYTSRRCIAVFIALLS